VKKLLLAGFAMSALIAPAIAADMPVPAAPTVTWTGFYLGANAGWGLSTNNSVNSVGVPLNCSAGGNLGCVQFPGFGPDRAYSDASARAATFSTPANQNGGFIAGGQFGYNYQTTANTVVGLEADLQATGSNHTFTFASVTPVTGVNPFIINPITGLPVPLNPIAQTATVTTRLDFLGTIRARGGWLWEPNFLTYVTAGLAYGEIELSSTIRQNVVGGAPNPNLEGLFEFLTPYTGVGTSKVVRFGGTIGAGFEWMVVPNWSVKAEYLYVGLGNPTVNSSLVNSGTGNLSSVNVVTSARFNDNIVRGGVNYHF
jgi:outer membrane immunogenic protein